MQVPGREGAGAGHHRPASVAAAAVTAANLGPLVATGGVQAVGPSSMSLSALSWLAYDPADSCAGTKAAHWSPTNGVRLELAGQRALTMGLHLASTDTDMMGRLGRGRERPRRRRVRRPARSGRRRLEVLTEDNSTQVKAGPAPDRSALRPQAHTA